MGLFGRILILALFTLSACTEKGKPHYEHEPDRRRSEDPPPADAAADAPVAAPPADLQTLADRVLAPKRVSDPAALLSRESMDELILLNRRLLQADEAGRSDPLRAAILRRYEEALFTECGDFADSCTGFKYFRRSPESYLVVKELARADSPRRFRLLLAALKIKPHVWDAELVQMLLQSADQAGGEDGDKISAQSLLETALRSLQNKAQGAETRSFLESIHAWRLIGDGSFKLSDAGRHAVIGMIAGAGVMYAKDGGLDAEFKKVIALQSKLPSSYISVQNRLRGQPGFRLDAMGVEQRAQMDELLYLIDAVFTGTLSSRDGIKLFAASRRSGKELEQAVSNYLRLQFVSSLYESTRLARSIFEANVQLENLLRHAIRSSSTLQSVWNGFRTRIQPLQSFALMASRQRADSEERERRLRRSFDAVDDSILVSSVYPLELALFFTLAQKRFELQLPNGRSIDSSAIMRLLFEGEIPPLFPYANSNRTLKPFELVHAVDFAIRTQMLQVAGIDPDEFIAQTIRALAGPNLEKAENHLAVIDARLKQTSYYGLFRDACAELRSGRPVARRFYFTELKESPVYGQLNEYMWNSISSANVMDSGIVITNQKVKPALMYMDATYSELLEQARLDLGGALRLAEGLLAAHQDFLRGGGHDEKGISAKTARTRAAIQAMKDAREKVLTRSAAWYKDIGACYHLIALRDHEAKLHVLRAQEAFFRDIHRKISWLRDPAVPSARKAEIQESLRFTGLPGGYRGQDKISEGGFSITEIDTLIRTADWVRNGLRTDSESIPPVAPQVQIDLGFRLDVDVEIVRNTERGFVSYVESADAFVASGLQAIYSARYPFLIWFRDSMFSGILNWETIERSLLTLHRLESEIRGKTEIFPAEEVPKFHEVILNYANIWPEERRLYEKLHRVQKSEALSFDYRMVRYNVIENDLMQIWGIFDLPAKLAGEEALGVNWDLLMMAQYGTHGSAPKLRRGFMAAASEYYRSRAASSRPASVLPYNPRLDDFMDARLRQFVGGEIRLTEDFHQMLRAHAREAGQRPAEKRPRFDLNMSTTVTEPMLDVNVIPTWEAKVRRLHQTTQGCFLPGSKCEEFSRRE